MRGAALPKVRETNHTLDSWGTLKLLNSIMRIIEISDFSNFNNILLANVDLFGIMGEKNNEYVF